MVPDFLHEAPPTDACAAFIKESRMKFVNARQLDRKSGCTLRRTGGTRPEPKTVMGDSKRARLRNTCVLGQDPWSPTDGPSRFLNQATQSRSDPR
jgi:hypothetical protein